MSAEQPTWFRCGTLSCDAIGHEVSALDDGALTLHQTGPGSWIVLHA